MPIKEGDFVKLEFTGKVKETGDVIDTTSEEVAKEAGIYSENRVYEPLTIVVGKNHLIKALEDGTIGLDEGKSTIIDVSPEEAFGERDPKLIQLVPMRDFKKQGMKPYVGMEVNSNGHKGKVLTINGGRVKVDFNNPLAGKNLEYSLVISKIVEDDDEKIKGMIQLHYQLPKMDIDKTEIKTEGKTLIIKLHDITKYNQKSYVEITLMKHRVAKDIWENMDFEKVEFVDSFEKNDENTKSNKDDEVNKPNKDDEVNNEEVNKDDKVNKEDIGVS
jgi:peptidylprolyl isomerase/FKBP-type peptidyl-prolyl cis-trans isomerase SlyD